MTGTGYSDFLQALRLRESSDDYSVVNGLGYLGAYQFGEAALLDLGVVVRDTNPYDNRFDGGWTGAYGLHSREAFLGNPSAQDAVADAWVGLLWRYITHFELDAYLGQQVAGTTITASGLIAGAHLAGAGGLRTYLHSGGADVPADAFGTTVASYVAHFAGFALPFDTVAEVPETNDLMIGGPGRDRLNGQGGEDALYGGGGADRLRGGAGDDLLRGQAGHDRLQGGIGSDDLQGGAGRDRLMGGADADRLDGGAGRDRLRGGAGEDVFVFGPRSGRDRIVDFDPEHDRIEIRGATLSDLMMTAIGDDLMIRFAETTILLDGGRMLSVGIEDFIFV